MNVHTYRGHVIVKQHVGPMGWNVVKDAKCIKTGFKTLADAKAWITFSIGW
jgi:hypothetical protein